MLRATKLRKSYPTRSGELEVVRDATLRLERGESAVIMGPSGSGKSTLMNMLGTLEPPTSGEVSINGIDPFLLSERELARFRNRHIGFVFQEHHLLPQCSVLENVLLPTLAHGGNADCLERAKVLLRRVGLAERLDHRPAELSGGERQRVAIARALINEPSVLLADEPTGNLDRKTAQTVANLMAEVHREQGVVLLIVTHSQQLAEQFEKRWELVDGVLSTSGG